MRRHHQTLMRQNGAKPISFSFLKSCLFRLQGFTSPLFLPRFYSTLSSHPITNRILNLKANHPNKIPWLCPADRAFILSRRSPHFVRHIVHSFCHADCPAYRALILSRRSCHLFRDHLKHSHPAHSRITWIGWLGHSPPTVCEPASQTALALSQRALM